MNQQEILHWLQEKDPKKLEDLYAQAYEVKKANVGACVHFRGIIEFSNICQKNCFYCGIRKDNKGVNRYQMDEKEILETAMVAYHMGYGSIVLQSGERQDSAFIDFIENILYKIKELSDDKLGITLSLGEQSLETYQRWFKAGGHRYLLRIETSNPDLYKTLHPDCHEHDYRLKCLDFLKEAGYQVGTGVMIGLPGQSNEDLCHDILFLKEHDVDMVGMGPYIVQEDTPLAKDVPDFNGVDNLELSLKMIALTRIVLQDVNIASTTALQALSPTGREMGIMAGANIIMPNLTPTKYRKDYQLYDDKPCLDENATMCRSCLENRIQSIGETIGYNQWGDSPHFEKRTQQRN